MDRIVRLTLILCTIIEAFAEYLDIDNSISSDSSKTTYDPTTSTTTTAKMDEGLSEITHHNLYSAYSTKISLMFCDVALANWSCWLP